uniref:Uncharacterized protein n=1 Tax=Falco tinnunculus TaxID=100819 RepID=A0A8C4U328_FALTI
CLISYFWDGPRARWRGQGGRGLRSRTGVQWCPAAGPGQQAGCGTPSHAAREHPMGAAGFCPSCVLLGWLLRKCLFPAWI